MSHKHFNGSNKTLTPRVTRGQCGHPQLTGVRVTWLSRNNMPSIFSHAAAALALGKVSTGEKRPLRFWVLTALCAMLPDADVISFALGVERGSMFSHRGLTHSLAFALL